MVFWVVFLGFVKKLGFQKAHLWKLWKNIVWCYLLLKFSNPKTGFSRNQIPVEEDFLENTMVFWDFMVMFWNSIAKQTTRPGIFRQLFREAFGSNGVRRICRGLSNSDPPRAEPKQENTHDKIPGRHDDFLKKPHNKSRDA